MAFHSLLGWKMIVTPILTTSCDDQLGPEQSIYKWVNVKCITLFSLNILVSRLLTFTGWPHKFHPGQRTLSRETITIYLLLCIVRQSYDMYFSQWCGLCQEALNPKGLCILEYVTWELGHLEITAALYVSCGMFPNNIENIFNLRKLQQLLFHFCQKDTFFPQYLNHNSDCKQCPGNLVLTLDWNYVSVQISMHTHYFKSCTQIFQIFLAFKIIITWHTLAKFLPIQYYQ